MKELKAGDCVEYHEDGGICNCELLSYERVEGDKESAKLKILQVIGQPRIGEYVVGDEFEVWHKIGQGCWGGDWHIFPKEIPNVI